jgi:hypothetical protein
MVLRGWHRRFEDIELSPASSDVLQDVQGDSLEILAEFEPGDADGFGIKVRWPGSVRPRWQRKAQIAGRLGDGLDVASLLLRNFR